MNFPPHHTDTYQTRKESVPVTVTVNREVCYRHSLWENNTRWLIFDGACVDSVEVENNIFFVSFIFRCMYHSWRSCAVSFDLHTVAWKTILCLFAGWLNEASMYFITVTRLPLLDYNLSMMDLIYDFVKSFKLSLYGTEFIFIRLLQYTIRIVHSNNTRKT